MKRLLIIGPAPQNIGGISIHIRRLVSMMKNNYEIDYVDEGHTRYEGIFNIRSGNIFRYLRKVASADIVHVQSGIWILRAFHIIVGKFLFRKKVVVTIHRDPTIEPHTKLTRKLLQFCNYAILVNREGYEATRTDSGCRYELLPAFLPPIMTDEPQLPVPMMAWIDKARMQGCYIMSSNAWNLVLHNGEDLYGLDLCIEAMRQLDAGYRLIFVVASNTGEQERMRLYKQLIKDYGLGERILLWEEPISFVRLAQQSDLILRTTNTDGDAISIREALYVGKPVLASDVVRRPVGVTLFKTRDAADLTIKIREMKGQKGIIHIPKPVDYQAKYSEIYG